MVNVKDPFLVPGSNDPIDIAHWVNRICTHRSEIEKHNLLDACNMAYEIHAHQTRVSGDPYLAHVLTVADILADLGMDTDVLISGILHEANDDKDLKQIEKRFGENVRHLVEGTNKMHAIEEISQHTFEQHWEDKQKERFRKMLLAMAEDVRVVLIKLADRLDRMRTLRYEEDEAAQHRIAQETLDLYAPLANRLGIWQIKWELEDLSLRYLDPTAYKELATLLDERRVDREQYIQGIMSELTQALAEEGIQAEISGRPKHLYSIWNKMNRKQTDFERIFDVLAVRVLVQNVTQCYTVLGIVHRRWQPIPHEFDDYIASPKHNNYQSLHTAVYGPDNKVFEVQIRTLDMHRHAELGVAAHWRYKEGDSTEDQRFNSKIAWLRQILQTREEDIDSDDLIDRFKAEIYEDRVYVLSPKGKVVDLPKGATPLDFAYHIHTQLGHRCRGAKISGHIVPLNYELQSGEQVEILTSSESRPSRDWLNPNLRYLQTSRARSKVRHWLTKQNAQQHITDGRYLLEKEFTRLNVVDIPLDKLAQQMRFSSSDAFLASLGRGDITIIQVARVLQDLCFPNQDKIKPVVTQEPSKNEHSDIRIRGVGGLLTQTAGCCKPIPYEPIIGYVTKMRGVVVHRQDCPNALRWQNEDNERLIEVEWGAPESEDSQIYPIDIQILAYDRKGLLHDVCQIMLNDKINILATNTLTNKEDDSVKMQFTVEVTGLDQLSRTLAKVDNLTNVMDVKRVR